MPVLIMTVLEAIEILKIHNKWRRGGDYVTMASPEDLGKAIDIVVGYFERLKDRKLCG